MYSIYSRNSPWFSKRANSFSWWSWVVDKLNRTVWVLKFAFTVTSKSQSQIRPSNAIDLCKWFMKEWIKRGVPRNMVRQSRLSMITNWSLGWKPKFLINFLDLKNNLAKILLKAYALQLVVEYGGQLSDIEEVRWFRESMTYCHSWSLLRNCKLVGPKSFVTKFYCF